LNGRPFLEILSSVVNEEYRFPVLEVFAALFALGTLVLAGLFGSSGHFAGTDEGAGNDRDLYGDVLKLAREAGARVTGIETGTSSLEELFRMATGDGDDN